MAGQVCSVADRDKPTVRAIASIPRTVPQTACARSPMGLNSATNDRRAVWDCVPAARGDLNAPRRRISPGIRAQVAKSRQTKGKESTFTDQFTRSRGTGFSPPDSFVSAHICIPAMLTEASRMREPAASGQDRRAGRCGRSGARP